MNVFPCYEGFSAIVLSADRNIFLIHSISKRVGHTEDVKGCMYWLAILTRGDNPSPDFVQDG